MVNGFAMITERYPSNEEIRQILNILRHLIEEKNEGCCCIQGYCHEEKKDEKIVFVCVHNSCRSQIAEVLCKMYAGDLFDTYSAWMNSVPEISSSAIRLMKTHYGIDLARQKPKTIFELPKIDIRVTMGCEITCQNMPVSKKISWQIDDPNGKPDEEFLAIIHTISDHVRMLAETMRYD